VELNRQPVERADRQQVASLQAYNSKINPVIVGTHCRWRRLETVSRNAVMHRHNDLLKGIIIIGLYKWTVLIVTVELVE
jgi:hypothetical protein